MSSRCHLTRPDAEEWIADNYPGNRDAQNTLIQCVKMGAGSFACRMEVATTDGPRSFRGTLACEDDECVWRDG